MYRVIVADDDRVIRTNIAQFIDGMEGWQVVKQFDNGKDIIEYIKDNKIEVILTDIKMRQMSGLDVAEYITQNSLDIRVVLLSGYRDFSYAQRAVELEVNSYLTKPIMPSEIKRVFNKIKDELDEQYSKELYIQKSKDASDNIQDEGGIVKKALDYINDNYLKNISLRDVANHVYLSENYCGKLLKTSLKIGFTDYIISLRINEAIRLLKLKKYSIKQISEKVGYNDCSYFIRVFKNVTGYTPKKYCLKENIYIPEEN